MHSRLRTVAKTIQYEWKIQVRQRATWMMACLFFLIGWFSVDHAQLPMLSAIAIAKGTAEGLGLFGSLFVVILGATGLLREFNPDYDLLWERSFSTYDYVIGKYIGVCAVVGTSLLPIGVWVGYWEGVHHGLQGLVVQAVVWMALLFPTLVIAVTVTSWVGVVFRHPIWTALVLVLTIGSILALQVDVTHIAGFPFGVYASPLVGFGPDTRLVRLHQSVFLIFSLICLLSGYVLVRVKPFRLEPRVDLFSWWGVGLSFFGLVILLVSVVQQFIMERNALLRNPQETVLNQETGSICSILHSYQLELSIDFDDAQLEGKAKILLRPMARTVRLPMDLNQGLHISKTTTSPPDLEIELGGNQLVLDVPQELVQQKVALALEYSGNIWASRRLYDRQFRSPEESLAPYWPGGYIDHKTAFLVRDGNWHPFPWCVPEQLIIEGKGTLTSLVHTAEKLESSSGHVKLTWSRKPPLPLIALSRNYRTMEIGKTKVLVAPSHLSDQQWKEILAPYPVLMNLIQEHLHEESSSSLQSHYTIAQVPLLRYGRYDPVSGIVLLKEFSPLDYFVPERYVSSEGPLRSQESLYQRWVAERMMRMWWCRDSLCPELQVSSSGYSIGHQLLARPDGSNDAEYHGRTILDALLSYAALRLAVPLVGDEFVTAEMSARQNTLQDETAWTEYLLPLISSPETNRWVLRLHKLWAEIGPESFWRLVRETHRHYGRQSLSAKDFSDFVEATTGRALPSSD